MDLYPVYFHLRDDLEQQLKGTLGEWEGALTANSEEELQPILKAIWNEEKTKLVIGSLMAQSQEPDYE